MALRAALFVALVASAAADAAPAKSDAHETKAQKAEKRLQAREDRARSGRKEVDKGLAEMAKRHAHLIALANNSKQLDELSSEIELRVQPTLSSKQRKSLEDDYELNMNNIRQQNMSAADAQQAVAGYETAVNQNLNALSDADHKDARNLRRALSKERSAAHSEVNLMAKATKKSLRAMGSPTGLEMAMQHADKTEHEYDSAEDDLQHQKDKLSDQVDSLHDQIDDSLEDVYSKVDDRVQARANDLEDDARSRKAQAHQALAEVAQTMKLSGSMSRVEEKLNRLETTIQKNSHASQEELVSSAVLVRTNTVCMALIAAGLAASLVMHTMQRRTESTSIRQPWLLA
jgi:hypothetical protein